MKFSSRLRRLVLYGLLVVAFVFSIAPTAFSQATNATLTGTIKDQTGAAIVGATVTATNTSTAIQKTGVSNSDGYYTIVQLAPGMYDVQATQKGFATMIYRAQEILVGTTVTRDFAMQVSSVTQVVEVTSNAAIIEPTQTSVERVLAPEVLNDLPTLNRSFSDLAVLAPGVQATGVNTSVTPGGTGRGAGLPTIGGSPTYESGFVADGITMEAGNQGGPYVTLSQDWVQEFSIIALQFPAEYGEAAGGVVNVSTRSGTNQIHGRVYGFFQNADLNANPEFYKGTTKAPFNSQRGGGMLGGPIKKGKLFYFIGDEFFHQLSTAALPTGQTAGAFLTTAQPLTTAPGSLVPWLVWGNATSAQTISRTNIAMLRLDYTPNAANSFIIRSNIDYEYTYSNNTEGSNAFFPRYGEVLGWTRVISPTAVNDLRFGFYKEGSGTRSLWTTYTGKYAGQALNTNPYNYVTTQSLGGATAFGNPDGYWANVTYNGFSTGGPTVAGLLNAEASGLIDEVLALSRGHHEIKVGGQIRRYTIYSNQGVNQVYGSYSMSAKASPFNPNTPITPLNLTTGTFTAAQFSSASLLAPLSDVTNYGPPAFLDYNLPSWAFGIFAQDSWKIRPHFTLNYGLRYDFSNTNSSLSKAAFPALDNAVPGSQGFIAPGWHPINNDPFDFAPRLGIAWSPFHDDDKTVIRGGVGVFYDQNDTASVGVYENNNSGTLLGYSLASNVATRNPYCVGNSNCATTIPVQYELAVLDVLASALANYTLPQFPTSASPCAATNSCTVAVGSNTYTIPALSVPYNPQGDILDMNPNIRVPGTLQATAGIQHVFANSLSVSADFVYHYGFNGLITVNPNVALTGPGASQSFVTVNPAYTTLEEFFSGATLEAKDLQVKASYRDKRGDSIYFAYQLGYSSDDDYSNFGISARNALITNPFNAKIDYGPSENDARNTLNASGIFNLHWGIQLAPIVSFTSALPFTATSSLQTPGSSAAPAGCLAYFSRCYPAGYSRDSLRGGNLETINARLSKSFRFGESRTLTAFFEGFNITNRHNLGTNFNANVDNSATFLTPLQTAAFATRQLQLGGKFDF
jgi:hypothetical protein